MLYRQSTVSLDTMLDWEGRRKEKREKRERRENIYRSQSPMIDDALGVAIHRAYIIAEPFSVCYRSLR